jgi:hypothetical protein
MHISSPIVAALEQLHDEINALGGSVPDGDFIGQIRMDFLDQILDIIDKHRAEAERLARLALSVRDDPDCVVRGLFQRSDGARPPAPVRRLPVSRFPKERHRQPTVDLSDEMVVAAMAYVPGCDHDDMVSALEAALGLPVSDTRTREGSP